MQSHTLAMSTTRPWHVSRRLDIIAHLEMPLELVIQYQLSREHPDFLHPIRNAAVKIWDTVGEEQILKGEYKVISGKMYECLLTPPLADNTIIC